MGVKRLPFAAHALLGAGAATWPVWRWYGQRTVDGSDEPWGLLALVTLGALRLREGRAPAPGNGRLLTCAAALLAYAAAYGLLPPMGRAVLALAAVGGLIVRGEGAAAQWGLLGLSLPIMATLQFYAGYPLRLLAAECSAVVLRICGYAVVREGALLQWAGETVMVDAPCSGVHMLWCGAYLAFLLAALHRLNARCTAACAGGAALIVVFANALRAAALFFKEAHIVQLPGWTHEGVGVALFALAAWIITAFGRNLRFSACAR